MTGRSVATSLSSLLTTIKNTAISIKGTSTARSVGLTVATTSTGTSTVSKAVSGLEGAFSVGGTSTTTEGNGSIANGGGGLSVRAESVESEGSSSRWREDARTAGTFPFSNRTKGVDVSLGRVRSHRSASSGRLSSRSESTNFHGQDVSVKDSRETSSSKTTRGDANRTLRVRGGGTVDVLAEVRTTKTITESNIGNARVIRESQTIIRSVHRVGLIATFASTRVGTRDANLLEEGVERNLFTAGELDETEARGGGSSGKRVIGVEQRRVSQSASITLLDNGGRTRSVSALHASSRKISLSSSLVAKRVRDIGVAISIVVATARGRGTSHTSGTGRRGFALVGPFVGGRECASDLTLTILLVGFNVGIHGLVNTLFYDDSEARLTEGSIFNGDFCVIGSENSAANRFPNVFAVFVSNNGKNFDGSLFGDLDGERAQAARRIKVHTHSVIVIL